MEEEDSLDDGGPFSSRHVAGRAAFRHADSSDALSEPEDPRPPRTLPT